MSNNGIEIPAQPNQQIPFLLLSSGTLNFLIKGKSYNVSLEHPNYSEIKDALRANDAERIVRLADLPSSIEDFSRGNIAVRNGLLYYEDEVVDETLSPRILDLIRQKLPFDPMLLFLENLMENSSARAVRETYPFLVRKIHLNGTEYAPLPITTDGCFIAYKSVRWDYMDHYTGLVDNHPGKKPRMRRNKVDDNWGVACSDGYHVGSLAYVSRFHPPTYNDDGTLAEGSSRIVVVKVNPRDVVSVPADEDETKCRVCEYEVLSDFEGELKAPIYHASTRIQIPVGHDIPVLVGVGRSDTDPFDESETPFSETYYEDEDDFEDDDEDDFEDDEDDDDEDLQRGLDNLSKDEGNRRAKW